MTGFTGVTPKRQPDFYFNMKITKTVSKTVQEEQYEPFKVEITVEDTPIGAETKQEAGDRLIAFALEQLERDMEERRAQLRRDEDERHDRLEDMMSKAMEEE